MTTTTTQPHDSLTCNLGPDGQPCTMCWWANGSGYVSRDEQSLLTEEEAQLVIGAIPLQALPDEPRDYNDKQIASVATIRAALFDVIDGGDPDNLSEWLFYKTESDWQTRRRAEFVNAVIERIGELQCPSHGFDVRTKEPSDEAIRAYSKGHRAGYADGWAAAHTATLREQNADLKEMLRLAQVRKGEQ